MTLVKVQKTSAYHKRFQTKYRRRREGKTDYAARRRMIFQMKDKYDSPKYRLVVRLTNTDVVCQIVSSKIVGDMVLCAAYSHELKRYGIPVGLTNYASAYATGLLLARRTLKKLHMDTQFVGLTKDLGKNFDQGEIENGRRPFKCILDVGLRRTTTGSRVFAAMKGVCDGGINVPHSDTRFVGHGKKYETLDTEMLRKHLFGGHVADYMRYLKETDPAKFEAHFSQYIKAGIKPEDIEKMYAEAHKKIRENPDPEKKEKKAAEGDASKEPLPKPATKRFRTQKRSLKTRKFLLEKRKAKIDASRKSKSAHAHRKA